MKRKDGEARSDYQYELDDIIIDVLCEKKIANTETIRQKINETYQRKLGWETINRHLIRLLDNKKIKLFYETKGIKRTVRLYKIVVK